MLYADDAGIALGIVMTEEKAEAIQMRPPNMKAEVV